MPSQFDLLRLPPELRLIVYELYFTSQSDTNLKLTVHAGTETALLTASKLVHNECYPIYTKQAKAHGLARKKQDHAIKKSLLKRCREHLRREHLGRRLTHFDCPEFGAALVADSLALEKWPIACDSVGDNSCRVTIGACGCDMSAPLSHSGAGRCDTCVLLLRLAVFFTALRLECLFLLDEDGRLTPRAREISSYVGDVPLDPMHEFHCKRSFGQDYWRLELEKQQYLDMRCRARLKAAQTLDADDSDPPSDARIEMYEIANMWPQLAEYEHFNAEYMGGQLKWWFYYPSFLVKVVGSCGVESVDVDIKMDQEVFDW